MPENLRQLTPVDLSTVWETEPQHFTPWLAQEENLTRLGETLRIDLELEAQEINIGGFRADLLCKNTVDDSWVLIENQLASTDHTHVGQLLTYAAGLDASTVIWIAKTFRREHRAMLELRGKTEKHIFAYLRKNKPTFTPKWAKHFNGLNLRNTNGIGFAYIKRTLIHSTKVIGPSSTNGLPLN